MSRSRWITVAATAVVVFALAGWWWKARGASSAPKYRTATVERGSIEALVSATGTIRPVVQVDVGSQVSGTVQSLFADYNSRVRKGQVLCQLEPSSLRARVVQADASVARAQASLKESQRNLRRARELIAQNYISQAEIDGHEVTVEQREAELRQTRAQLEAARVDLAHTTIRAPIDGVVIARTVDLGQTVAASLQAPQLFVIANDLAQMQVETRIDEADIGLIHPGLPVRFTVDAFPDFTFDGRVAQVRLEPIVEQGVVTYTTIIHTENPAERLRPGMTANVSVRVAERADAVKVPNAALRFRPPSEGPGGPHVRAGGSTAASARAARDGEAQAAPGPPRAGMGPGGPKAGGASSVRGPGAGMRGAGRGGAPRMGAKEAVAGGPLRDPGALKPGSVYVLRAGKPVKLAIRTGLSDGAFTEIQGDELLATDQVIVGLEQTTRGQNLQPPPGMGGFGGPGGGGGGQRRTGGGGR